MDIKCCNISMLYSGNDIDIILTDIETGRLVVFYSKEASYESLMNEFRRLLVSCIDDVGEIPSTFIFVGEWCYADATDGSDEGILLFNMDTPFLANFVLYKMYACYMEYAAAEVIGAKFFDICTDKEVYVSDANERYIIDTKNFVDRVKRNGYEGFNKSGENAIIIGGNISHYDENIGVSCNHNLLVGTIESVYNMLLGGILHKHG